MAETQTEEPRRYPCKRCGGAIKVAIAEAQAHFDAYHQDPEKLAALAAKREAARARFQDPEFRKKLTARWRCVTCGEKPSYHADPAVGHAFLSPNAEREEA